MMPHTSYTAPPHTSYTAKLVRPRAANGDQFVVASGWCWPFLILAYTMLHLVMTSWLQAVFALRREVGPGRGGGVLVQAM